jgi:hypothetical protein
MEAALYWVTDRNHGGIEILRAVPYLSSLGWFAVGWPRE